jgi:hypothetical protein
VQLFFIVPIYNCVMCFYISVLVCFSVSYEVLFVVDTNSVLDYIVFFIDKVVCYTTTIVFIFI